MSGGIYCITNKVNNKRYIGQSINVDKRLYQHKSNLIRNIHKNEHLQFAFNKYGYKNFRFEILERCKFSKLDEREIYYILLYSSNENGYNIEGGGNKNKIVSDETRAKQSEKAKGRMPWNFGLKGKSGQSSPFKGKKRPNISAALIAKYKREVHPSKGKKNPKLSISMKGRIITWGKAISKAKKGKKINE